jgi:hypothetical protein
VVDCKLVNSASLMETNVALIVLMAMEIKNSVHVTLGHAQLIVRGVGASTVLVLQLVVGESRNECIASPERPLMAAKLARRQAALRKSMRAAQNHARQIAKATGRNSLSAPMAVLVQMAWNVVLEASSIVTTPSQWKTRQVDANVRPRCLVPHLR